ncbi:MAG: DUF3048 domain-containing protein [Lachnospiraceae bacterium]|nr:DUF3048 domain-containing protein [Candidatus Merdinaster equi]
MKYLSVFLSAILALSLALTNGGTSVITNGATLTEDTRDGFVRSQLTNEWIDDSIANKRPLAVMIPDNPSALPQYGISRASIIYECVVESDVCRLLCLFDDYRDMDRIGNVRSARKYFVYWALEWDPLFFHCGNVYYADEILDHPACDNINCVKINYGWYRVNEAGRIKTQALYTSTKDVETAAEKLGYSLDHTDYFQKNHWRFSNADNELILSASDNYSDVFPATMVDFGDIYLHDKPYFVYNEKTGLYDRFQFGDAHIDAAYDDVQLSFKNVLVQFCDADMIDLYDHWEYHTMDGGEGYYLTNGEAIPVTWSKEDTLAPTKFYSTNGQEITLNEGKTMVCVVNSKKASSISFP